MANPGNRFNIDWNKLGIKEKPLWSLNCKESVALAVCENAVVIANRTEIVALDFKNGEVLWSQPVPSPPVPWGLAVDRNGNVVVSLENGQVLCFGSRRQA
jgi:outer membrane protein assembly factor BamB